MRYISAYMLLALGGKESPSTDDVKSLLEKAGVEVDADKLAKLGEAMEGKNIDEVIAEGTAKMKALAGAGGGGGGGGGGGEAAAAVEEKVEEEEEEVDLGGGGMFGDEAGY